MNAFEIALATYLLVQHLVMVFVAGVVVDDVADGGAWPNHVRAVLYICPFGLLVLLAFAWANDVSPWGSEGE